MSEKKSKKIEKETRRLLEGISDLVKSKNGQYKFKGKKKQIKKFRKSCFHWIIRKNNLEPSLSHDVNPANWHCDLCNAVFPKKTLPQEEYDNAVKTIISHINQIQFYSVKMGGSSDDSQLFLRLKKLLPEYSKAQRNIVKQINKRKDWEDRKENTDSLSQFDGFVPFGYKH